MWLAAPCTITLTETATFFLLEKADSQIAIDSEQARRVQERNDQYAALVKGKEPSRYAERSAQHRGRPALPSPGAPEWMFDPNNPPIRMAFSLAPRIWNRKFLFLRFLLYIPYKAPQFAAVGGNPYPTPDRLSRTTLPLPLLLHLIPCGKVFGVGEWSPDPNPE